MKMHLNLATRELDASVEFYRTLLQIEPAKHYGDYALFIGDDPGLELALDLDADAPTVTGAHYGIVVDTPDDVEAAIKRLEGAKYPVDIEREETCCYAVQTKVWATDPDGRRWEVYTVLEDVEDRNDASACCADESAAVELATAR